MRGLCHGAKAPSCGKIETVPFVEFFEPKVAISLVEDPSRGIATLSATASAFCRLRTSKEARGIQGLTALQSAAVPPNGSRLLSRDSAAHTEKENAGRC